MKGGRLLGGLSQDLGSPPIYKAMKRGHLAVWKRITLLMGTYDDHGYYCNHLPSGMIIQVLGLAKGLSTIGFSS